MNLHLKVEWLRKLKNKSVEEQYCWRNPDQWCDVEIEALSENDLTVLLSLMEKHKDVKGSVAVKQKINTYRRLITDAKGVKISRLEPLVTAIKLLMEPTPHKWVFSENADGYMVPWYVYDVNYCCACRETPACTEIKLAANKRGAKITKTVSVYTPDLGATASELLRRKGYFIETPELVDEYLKENKRYQEVCGLTGEQFFAVGEGFHAGRLVAMERDQKASKVVMDDDSEEDEERGRDYYITSKFWKGNADADDGESDEGTEASLPLHPYVKVFDLDKHLFVVIHAVNLIEYIYDDTLIDKLVLPAEHKELVSMLVDGADVSMEDIVRGKTGGIIVICTGPPGTGKCHGRGTKVMLYTGESKNVEDIRVGDLLMGDDSAPRCVLSLAQGRAPLYRIRPLRGGEPFTVNNDHVMVLAQSPMKTGDPLGLVEMSLERYRALPKYKRDHLKLIRVPVTYQASNADDLCLVDPYWLGLWLGDGNAGYTGITTMDRPVVAYIRAYAKKLGLSVSVKVQPGNKSSVYTIVGTRSGSHHDNHLLAKMEALGLSVQREKDGRRHGSEKFIPHRYLVSSRGTRLNLLAGIIDSDGYTSKGDGVYDGSFVSERFAKELAQLARSLGYTASVKPKKGSIKNIGFVGSYYRVCLSAVHDLPLRVPRRKAKNGRGQKKRSNVTGFDIDSIGEDDYFGFTLDGNGRYLLSDFTVTHNTLTSEVFSEQVRRPLYRVQCSQLGTDESKLEDRLKIVLNRAQRWKAILLIDEADVYVHSRGNDIQQNAIVGVWLRVLEYYRGILFMTSNRETVIDDAIMSRATAWIRYDIPDRANAIAIWQILATQYSVDLTSQDIETLVDMDQFIRISGRSIKNLLKLAKLRAERRGKQVNVESIVYASQFLDL